MNYAPYNSGVQEVSLITAIGNSFINLGRRIKMCFKPYLDVV